jgi:GntR family transcriptional repressor for pyruvate dehydrogenase complex
VRSRKDVFSSVRTEPLSTRIVNQVIEAIYARELKAGQHLGTEAQLAETFQTSRMPIREALGRLEALGVLKIKAGAGGGATIAEGAPDRFATALSVQFMLIEATVEEIFDARIAIETRAAELAADKATPDDIATLTEIYERINAGDSAGRDAVQNILDFHVAVVDASQSRTLKALMHGLDQPLVSLYLHPGIVLAGRAAKYKGLLTILDAIRNRMPVVARETMHDHLVSQRNWLAGRMAEALAAEKESSKP